MFNMPVKKRIILFLLAAGLFAFLAVSHYGFLLPAGKNSPARQPAGESRADTENAPQPNTSSGNGKQGTAGIDGRPQKSPRGNAASDGKKVSPGKRAGSAGPAEDASPGGGEPSVTVSDIEKKYRPQFLALKAEYNARLNNLAARALNEYLSYKQNNQNPPVLSLVKKYLKAGSALEAECDRRFNALLARMEQDLVDAGLPLDLVNKAKREYESQKIQRKKQLIQSGLKFAGI